MPLPWGLGLGHAVSAVKLLAFPLTFTQTTLLSPEEFVKEARIRGIAIWPEQLTELYRRRALVPILGIRTRRDRDRPPVQVWYGAANRYHQFRSNLALVIEAAQRGLLVDPLTEHFGPWTNGLELPMGGDRKARYPSVFYSWYQLLGLRVVDSLCREMTAHKDSDGGLHFTMKALRAGDIALLDGGRRLAILLSALDMQYLPNIMLKVSHPEEWNLGRGEYDAQARAAIFGVGPEDLAKAAENLLFQGETFDPLGSWYDLVRRAHPDTWAELEGPARLAMDYRVASEVFLQFVEDLGRGDLTKPPPRQGRIVKAILDDRLGEDRSDLDDALMRRGLSPQPSLLFVVEGRTELELMPRVLAEIYGGPVPPTLIEVANMDSIDRDLDLLIRHVLAPRIGQSTQEVALLTRPPTRVLVAVDPEKRFETPAMQEAERLKLVRRLVELVPMAMRTPAATAEIDSLVRVTTWGSYPWEFANFTDHELARGLLSRGTPPSGLSMQTLLGQVHAQRLRPPARSNRGGPNIDNLCKGWPGPVEKMMLAEALWPVLRRKVRRGLRTLNYRVPAGRVAVEALRIALGTHRRQVGLRIR